MAGTKHIRLGKVERFIETLEIELTIKKETIQKLSDKNPAKTYFEGENNQLETVINNMKRWFDLNE